jgi:hypothetical protein
MSSVSPFIEDFIGFAQSTDGGATWRVAQNVYDVNGITGTLTSKNNIRVNGLPHIDIDKSGGARNNCVYIVTTEKNLAPAGTDPDIILHRSTDGGLTWSTAKRVNQDALNDGKIQYFPALHVDAFGGVNIIYYDDRNTSSDSAEVMIARSVDGGDSWTERVISNHRFKPRPILGGSSNYQGDHIALTSSGTKLHAFWMDNSSGLYQIWTCQIELQSLEVLPTEPPVPSEFRLNQNYPNPFNPSTNIEYRLPARLASASSKRAGQAGEGDGSYVTLKVYDLLGREVAMLVNGQQLPGGHSVVLDAEKLNLPSGVYYYRLTAGNHAATKSMVLIK